jgi:hypothetical protein
MSWCSLLCDHVPDDVDPLPTALGLDGREDNPLSAAVLLDNDESTDEIVASRFDSGLYISVSVELTLRQAQHLADAITAGVGSMR